MRISDWSSDVCSSDLATVLAQKLLSAVYRTGQSYGAGHVEAVLTGRSDDRIVSRGHDKLSVFGLVGGEEARLIKPLVRTLMAREALATTEHGGLMFGPAGRSEEHTSELQSLMRNSYAVFCLNKKTNT